MKLNKIILIGVLLTTLMGCSRTHIGAISGAGTGTAACLSMGAGDPYITSGCALVGAFAGANIMYKSDYDVHNAVFVDQITFDRSIFVAETVKIVLSTSKYSA